MWVAAVDDPSSTAAGLDDLGEDERARAAKFHFERDRVRFVNRRLFLRDVVSQHLGTHRRDVRYRTSMHGRPELDGGTGPDMDLGLSFNASHSAGLAVVAVTHGHSIGVDVERQRPIADALDTAAGLFCGHEVAAIEAAPPTDRSRLFLRVWTRKEALVKATGDGLSTPLDSFEVLATDDAGTGVPESHGTTLPFTYSDIEGIDDYVAAIAIAGVDVRPEIDLRDTR